jgi:tetratricopeptide (TPR) repeat protein
MLRFFLGFSLLLFLTSTAQSTVFQNDTNDVGSLSAAAVATKMGSARHDFLNRNYRGALTTYRDITKSEPQNSKALYRTAQCYYELKRYDLAERYLDKSVKIDPEVFDEVDFFYGKIAHRLAKLDEAIGHFNDYLATNPSERSYEYFLTTRYIEQCQYAKEMMARPVDVNVENMGRSINSRFDDYTPSITADGKYLVFTSRRSDTKGGEIDEEGDYKFYEDVYYSTWDEEYDEWTLSENVQGNVNTEKYDAVLSIAPGGKELFIYRNNESSAGDIFISKYSEPTESWREPQKMPKPINTSYFEGSVSITEDGETLYFISERQGGIGRGDIYVSKKKKEGEWTKPENLGSMLNTEDDEKFVYIHPNGRTLYFASNGHQTMGSYDIFKSDFINGQWSVPVNLGFPINTVNEESTFSLTEDNQTLLIAAEYDDSYGERDIYKIDVSDYNFISGGYDQSNFSTLKLQVNDEEGEGLRKADVKIYNAISGRLITTETTDTDGFLKINLLGDQRYKVEAIFRRNEPASKEFELPLKEGKPAELNLELKVKT